MIADRVRLAQPPTVISAPPSEVSDYPTVSILMERFKRVWHQEDELETDSSGQTLLVGSQRSISFPVAAASLDSDHRLSRVGRIEGSGRIWVGARLAPQREKIETQISTLFSEDASAIGRVLVDLQPTISGLLLPWTWPLAFFLEDSEWTDEFAFSERLWSWIQFDVDLDVLAVRTDPLMTQIQLTLDADLGVTGAAHTSETVDVSTL